MSAGGYKLQEAMSVVLSPASQQWIEPHLGFALQMEPQNSVREATFAYPADRHNFECKNGLGVCDAAVAPPGLEDAIAHMAGFILRRMLGGVQSTVHLGAWQYSGCQPHAFRTPHFDPEDHGDIIATLTIEGTGSVWLGAQASDTPEGGRGEWLEVLPQRAGSFYTIFGVGLSAARHKVQAGPSGRIALTFRFLPNGPPPTTRRRRE